MTRSALRPAPLTAALFFASVLSTTHPASAATTTLGLKIEGDLVAAVRRHVLANARVFGARQAELRLEKRITLPKGEVLRFEQVHAGLPVFGRGVSVLVRGGHVVVMSGKLATIASLAGGPYLDRAQAAAVIHAHVPRVTVGNARLGIRPQLPARAVWRVRAGTLVPADSWRFSVDARSGELMYGISTRVDAEGWAYLPNPDVGELTQVTLLRLEDETQLTGAYADVQRCSTVDYENADCDRLASPMRNESFLWAQPDEPSIEDAFAEVNAYYHVDAFSHWLNERFGFTRSGGKQQLPVWVNFHIRREDGTTRGIPNAFFADLQGDGVGMLVFGQGRRDFCYDGDVIYHEFTHSAVHETSKLEPEFDEMGFNMMPTALNEAFADLISSAFTGDGHVGEYAGGSYGSMSIRDLSAQPIRCDDLSGESHQDSLIFSRLAWSVRDRVESKRAYDEVLYTTMVSLHSTASIDDALQVLLATARAVLPGTEGLIEDAIANAGLGSGCDRLLALEDGAPRRGYALNAAYSAAGFVPAGMQYRVDVPEDATKLTIKIRAMGHYSPEERPQMGAFVRKGGTVVFDGKNSLRDFTKTSQDDGITLTLDDVDFPLEPGASYYILPLNLVMQDVAYELTVETERKAPLPDAAPVELDAGVADQGATAADAGTTSADGGCAVGGGHDGGLALLLALALVRRRKRL